jgi:hypothetical protein
MNEDQDPPSQQSGSQSQVPPATQVTAEVDGFTITSASSVAPQTEESLAAAIQTAETAAPDAHATRSPSAEAAAEETPAPTEKPERPEKRKQTAEERHAEIQARIHAATRELRETERRMQAMREEAQRLQAPPPPAETPAARPRWKDYEEQGKSYIDYEDDLAKWDETRDQRNQAVVEQRLAQQQAEDRVRRDRAAYEARCDEARSKHPDWDDTIKANLNEVPQTPFLVTMVQAHPKGPEIFYDWGKNPDIARTWAEYDADPATRPTQPVMSALYESAHPTAMLEHLATHPDEYVRITRMAPVSALLALGKLETALAGAKNGSPGRPVSHAAAPLSHRAGSQQSGPTAATSDDADIEDFVRAENKRFGVRSPI